MSLCRTFEDAASVGSTRGRDAYDTTSGTGRRYASVISS